ncbi:rhodanese-like domain-containing protein [Prevotella dentasini]|uniref:rhodanese-like domain-containing protein n=1 Tax=Prevotella dentasini TaxID=589537 RepID=UPI000468A87E|nr:rhodanese-like domain-containing protein [Prevotella dentasini]
MGKILGLLMALLGSATVAGAQTAIDNVGAGAFEALAATDSVRVVDVRTAGEYAEGHIPGACNINVLDSSFVGIALGVLDPSFRIAVYCRSGRRSMIAARLLSSEGYRVTNLEGGYLAWVAEGKKVEKTQVLNSSNR